MYLGIHCRAEDGVGGFYVSDQIALYQRAIGGQVVVKEVAGSHYDLAFHHDLLWLKCGDNAARSVDGQYLNAPKYVAYPQAVGTTWVAGAYLDDFFSSYVSRYEISSGKEVSVPTEGYGALDADEKFTVLYDESRLSVYDEFLNESWSLEFDFKHAPMSHLFSRRPYICGEDIVVNLGVSCGEGQIVCISIANGSIKWIFNYEGSEPISFVHAGKLFVSQHSGIQVICIEAGKTVWETEVTFDWPFMAYPCLDGVLVYGADEAYFIEGYRDKVGEKVSIPEGYRIAVDVLPMESSDSISLYLEASNRTLSPALSGSLILSRGNSKDSCLTEDLAAMFMEVADKHGEKTYILTISEPNLDRLIRLGSIKLLEVCCTYGEHTFGTGGLRDKQHKGKIKVVIDREGLPDNAEESLAHWIGSIKKYLRSMAIFPGAGERYKFRIDVELN
jgi:hypothetical protein